jgi:hypothetical protein
MNSLFDNCDFTSILKSEILEFNYYPNPFTSEINIDIQTVSLPARVQLFNCFGKMVLKQTIYSTSFKIETQSLANGLYFYKLILLNGQIISGKIIKE